MNLNYNDKMKKCRYKVIMFFVVCEMLEENMSLIIQHNMPLLNAQNKYNVNTGNRAKSTEKLSSGYRINKAADDAAGLAISEKMRRQIRGLDRGTQNGQDGVSWVQTGDGALDEVHDILHRMKELTIQALNDTNTDEDRAALQAEMDSLQSEIDRITDTTQFNTKNIFADHEPTYYQFEGNVQWNQSLRHVISDGANDLVIQYTPDDTSGTKTVSITVPAGEYTTQELTDEIEDALIASGASEEGIVVEYTNDGTFNIGVEGGQKVEEITGELAYLLYDTYKGGSVGALIGTTTFTTENSKLTISNANNNLAFDIETFDGNTSSVDITIPNGSYRRQEIIDILNEKLDGTGVTATAYGSGIRLSSNDAIITGFKGNMFKIDEANKGEAIYSSVFYDNVKYGSVSMTAASFTGGSVMPSDTRDVEHQNFKINANNNQLTFTPNGSDTPVTITIDEGEYTMSQMVTKLNELFAANNLELTATSYEERIYSGGYKYYQGIKITSQVKGAISEVGLDSNSSAYNTLFVNRVYNNYKTDASTYRDGNSNADATFTGTQQHQGANLPVTIVSGINDQFGLNIDGTTYKITLAAGDYSTAEALKNEIDDKLNGSSALSGYKDLVSVEVSSGKIVLKSAAATGIVSLKAEAVAGNEGYDDIFEGEKKVITQNKAESSNTTGKPTITLNNPISDPANITEDNNDLTINLNGKETTVELPTGDDVTHDDIVAAIERKLKEEVITTDITFSEVNGKGVTRSNNFTASSQVGKTDPISSSGTNKGETKELQGTTDFATNTAAKVTIGKTLPESITIDSNNNYLQLTVNDTSNQVGITLSNDTYTRSQLVSEIQKKLDEATGTNFDNNGVKVSLNSSNQLVFESRLNYADGSEARGDETYLAWSTGTSSFFRELYTTRAAGTATTNALLDNISITEDSNILNFNYVEDGVSKSASITLDNGNYTREGFVNMLQSKLDAQNINIKASVYNNALRLTTNKVGTGNSVSYSTYSGGSSVEALFGPMVTETAATEVANKDIQDEIVIDSTSDEFNVTVNGTLYNLTLDHDTYTQSEFVDMLNTKLAGTGLSASLDGNKIRYTTDAVGSSATFKVTYADGGSAMKAIYGQDTIIIPGVTAEFNANNQLVLTGTQPGGSLSVNSSSGSLLQTPTITEEDIKATGTPGYYSTNHSNIDGVNISEPVKIDEWNNEMTFTYYDNGVGSNVSINVPEKEYTFAELQTELQSQIDSQIGADKLTVTVGNSGVRIEADNAGRAYYMTGFGGDFYYKVMCSTKEASSTDSPTTQNGTPPNDTAFTVGRKDVRNNPVEIKTGINDTLSLDFQYGGNATEFTITLDPGVYKGESLKNMIQEKLNEAMKAQGFSENMIEVGIGGISTGVVGSNDANALNFQLSKSVRLPGEGTYIIDGVSGNAAFSVFYQTDGELVPAYVKGAKEITEGVTIEDGENDLAFDVEGTNYSITLAAGDYTSDEIIAEVNNQLTAAGAPVVAEIEDGVLKISHSKLGERKIENITGGAKQALFYNETGEIGEKEYIRIQLSSEVGDYITIDRPIVNTVSLGINSIAITKPKYANKALSRIDAAVEMISTIRSDFGAKQNRLEHAIASNKNASENTQAAESRIRDLDMADEMVKYSKDSILMQAGEAMMAHAMTDAEGILRLLQ